MNVRNGARRSRQKLLAVSVVRRAGGLSPAAAVEAAPAAMARPRMGAARVTALRTGIGDGPPTCTKRSLSAQIHHG